MEILESMNKRVRKFSIIDVKLAQATAMLFLIIIAKMIPALAKFVLEVNIWIWVALFILVCIKPFYVFWFKKLG